MSGSGRRDREIVRLRPVSYSTSHGARLRLSGCGRRLVQPPCAGLAGVDHHGHFVLHRSTGRGSEPVRAARDFQHRSGQSVHQRSLHRAAQRRRYPDQHGRQGPLVRQRVRRALLAFAQIRARLPARLRVGGRSQKQDRVLHRVLQLPTPALQPGGTNARPGILPPSARSSGGLTRDKTGRGNAGLMESPENENTVFRPSHKTLKIDETYFHIPTAMTMTEQFFHLKPEKPVQTIGATSKFKLSLILFDEIEKASDALWQLLLGIFDKGSLTLGDNHRVDLSSSVLFLTSNLGATEMSSLANGGLGFRVAPTTQATVVVDEDFDKTITRTAQEAARRKFSPEFMNRIDKTVVFKTLRSEHLRRILDLELVAVQQRVLLSFGPQFLFNCEDEVKELLLSEGTDPKYGARHLKRVIERYLVFPLANLVATHQIKTGDGIKVTLDKDAELVFTVETEGSATPTLLANGAATI